MKQMKLVVFGCVVIVGFAGCNLAMVVPGSGISATEDRPVNDFSEISFAGSATATVVCGQDASLVVTVDDNLMESIKTSVKDGELSIYSEGNISPSANHDYQIATQSLNALTINGSGQFDIQNCNTDKLYLQINGSGNIVVTGTVEDVNVSIAGSGRTDLSQLTAATASIDIMGSGRATVNASNSINVSITGSGRIEYSGSPEIKKQIIGSGSIRQIKTAPNSNGDEAEKNAVEEESDDDSSDEEDEN